MSYRLLVILAHPDDEGVVSGTLARYAGNGSHVTLVSATRGEVGEISSPELATQETLGDVRTAELEEACRLLGIGPPRFLGFRDSGMAGAPENDDPRAFVQADPAVAVGRILALFQELRPHIVITFEPGGWYGHPDHVATARHVTAAYDAAHGRAPVAHLDGGPEPLWRPQRLYFAVIPHTVIRAFRDALLAQGEPLDVFEDLPVDGPDPFAPQITHLLDVRAELPLKRLAEQAHRTQFGETHPMQTMSDDQVGTLLGVEHFIQARPQLTLAPEEPPIGDLCHGVSDVP